MGWERPGGRARLSPINSPSRPLNYQQTSSGPWKSCVQYPPRISRTEMSTTAKQVRTCLLTPPHPTYRRDRWRRGSRVFNGSWRGEQYRAPGRVFFLHPWRTQEILKSNGIISRAVGIFVRSSLKAFSPSHSLTCEEHDGHGHDDELCRDIEEVVHLPDERVNAGQDCRERDREPCQNVCLSGNRLPDVRRGEREAGIGGSLIACLRNPVRGHHVRLYRFQGGGEWVCGRNSRIKTPVLSLRLRRQSTGDPHHKRLGQICSQFLRVRFKDNCERRLITT